jgi:hypothetical protein
MPKGYLKEPLVVTGPQDVAAVAQRGAQVRSHRDLTFPDRKSHSYQDPKPEYVYIDTIGVLTPWPRHDEKYSTLERKPPEDLVSLLGKVKLLGGLSSEWVLWLTSHDYYSARAASALRQGSLKNRVDVR